MLRQKLIFCSTAITALVLVLALRVPAGLWSPPSDGVILGPVIFDSSFQGDDVLLYQNPPNADLPERLEIRFDLTFNAIKPTRNLYLVQTSAEKKSGMQLLINSERKLELWGNITSGYGQSRVLLARSQSIVANRKIPVVLLIDQSKNRFILEVSGSKSGVALNPSGTQYSINQIQLEIDEVRLGQANMSSNIRIESFSMHFGSITNTANLDLIRYLLVIAIVFVLIPFSSEFLKKATELRIFGLWRAHMGLAGSLVFIASLVLSQLFANYLETQKSAFTLNQGSFELSNSKEQLQDFEWTVEFRLTRDTFAQSQPVLLRGTGDSRGISVWVDQYRNPFLVLESEQIGNEKIQVVKIGEPIDGPRTLNVKAKLSGGKVVSLVVQFNRAPVNVISVRDSTPLDLSKVQLFPFSTKNQLEGGKVISESVQITEINRTVWTVLVQIAVLLVGFFLVPASRKVIKRRELQSRSVE